MAEYIEWLTAGLEFWHINTLISICAMALGCLIGFIRIKMRRR